jgi:ABC-type phosphate/phosphonate transport system ATPase subunit
MLTRYDNRATEMDITMIGLQNAGKTSLLRVLAVSSKINSSITSFHTDCVCRAESLPSSMSAPLSHLH